MTQSTTGLVEKHYLLQKRGLYYGPNNSGYTGFKERAGRYLETEARPDCGVTAIHEDEAAEIAPSCFDDLAREYLSDKISKAETTIAELVAALEPSGDTKAAYMGEFSFHITETAFDEDAEEFVENQRKVYVPWDTIKQIMKAILEQGTKSRSAL